MGQQRFIARGIGAGIGAAPGKTACAAGAASASLPTESYLTDLKQYFNGEGIHMIHVPAAHTDGDSLVLFRGSDVIAAGDLFVTDRYPEIDVARGGTIDGYIAGLNRLLDLIIPEYQTEGGTMVVPGHGRLSDAADKRSVLQLQVEQGRHLFVKPRTLVFHGIKVGLQKGKGGIEIRDPDRTVALIEKHYTQSEAELLLRITKKPNKEALEELTADELKKLAVHVVDAGDQVVIKPADSEVDKVVAALLKGATDEAQEAS